MGTRGLAECYYLKPSSSLVALIPASQRAPLRGLSFSDVGLTLYLQQWAPPYPLEKQDISGEKLLKESCFTGTSQVVCSSNVAFEQATPPCE